MAIFEMKPEQVAKWKNDLWEEAEPHVAGEELVAVTPTKLHAFKWKPKGRNMVIGDEVAVWERAALEISTGSGAGMTKLTISSPSEGEKATLVGASVQDDPVSQALIEVLKSGSTTPVPR